MDEEIVIDVKNVSKKFSKSIKNMMFYGTIDIFSSMINYTLDQSHLRKDEFWALKDISFTVKKGEIVGLIGVNGSGKSTMLKLLNGIYLPSKGDISITGKTGALIEVGAGFHPMLSGRENIYINGTILGMTKMEIDEKFDEIVKFADIGDFINSPVKFYSSGMYVRLGFAIAIHSNPEILFIDEILSVGDIGFQRKCIMKMQEIMKSKLTTIVLVSHHLPTVAANSTKVIWLKKDEKPVIGLPVDVLSAYEKEIYGRDNYLGAIGNVPASGPLGGAEINNPIINLDMESNHDFTFKIYGSFLFEIIDSLGEVFFAIVFYRKKTGVLVTMSTDRIFHEFKKGEKSKCIFEIEKCRLLPGDYTIDFQLRSKTNDCPFATYRVQSYSIPFFKSHDISVEFSGASGVYNEPAKFRI